MSKLKVAMLDMIASPNTYSFIADNKWVIRPECTSIALWGQIFTIDSLSERRYIPAVGAVLRVVFLRADTPGADTSRTVSKLASFSVDDRSLFSVNLSSTDMSGIVSGSVRFELTEGSPSSVKTWVQDWGIRKEKTSAGF